MYMYPSHSISHSLSLPRSFFLSLPHRRDRNRSRSASSSRSSDRDRDDKKGDKGKGRGRSDSRADEEDLKKKSSRDEPDDGESLFAAIPMIDTSYCLSLSLSLPPSLSLSLHLSLLSCRLLYCFLLLISPSLLSIPLNTFHPVTPHT
jgi:hypothetical protein